MERENFLGNFTITYEEPFEGYNNYIKELKKHLGEEVNFQGNFGVIEKNIKKLKELEEFDDIPNELFPHRISFDGGLSINLRDVASILNPNASQININPESKDTFYLNIPKQREF